MGCSDGGWDRSVAGKETFEVVERKSGVKRFFKWKAQEVRAKARIKHWLFVMGCFQDTSLAEAFTLTAAHTTTKMILSYAARCSWRLESIDIDAAYLNREPPPDTYVLSPPGYREDSILWKLKRSLYGLATSPRTWFLHFVSRLLRYGLMQSGIEPCCPPWAR